MLLNCDLGEGEAPAIGHALMKVIDLANVACGGHAGDAASMTRYTQWCRELKVRLGAHPGSWQRGDHGRGPVEVDAGELELLLLHQVGALQQIAARQRVRLDHIKLHGALYHASESDSDFARVYVGLVTRYWPRLRLIVQAGGRVARLARRAGLQIWEEAFVDRAYRDDGQLVPRGEKGALLPEQRAVAQARRLMEEQAVETASGHLRAVRAQTLCVHSDTPGAVAIARRVAREHLKG